VVLPIVTTVPSRLKGLEGRVEMMLTEKVPAGSPLNRKSPSEFTDMEYDILFEVDTTVARVPMGDIFPRMDPLMAVSIVLTTGLSL